MLNVFNKKNYKQYKTAVVVDRENNEYFFKYYKMNRTDIADNDMINNIGVSETKFVIMTTDNFNFTPENRIRIEGRLYHIEGIYEEDSDDENGLFRNHLIHKKYITIKR